MNDKKITNGENVDNLRKREYLRYGLIISSFLTILFAVLDVILDNYIFLIIALVFFVIANILNKLREKVIIKRRDEINKEIDNFIEINDKKTINDVITKDDSKKKATSKKEKKSTDVKGKSNAKKKTHKTNKKNQ